MDSIAKVDTALRNGDSLFVTCTCADLRAWLKARRTNTYGVSSADKAALVAAVRADHATNTANN